MYKMPAKPGGSLRTSYDTVLGIIVRMLHARSHRRRLLAVARV